MYQRGIWLWWLPPIRQVAVFFFAVVLLGSCAQDFTRIYNMAVEVRSGHTVEYISQELCQIPCNINIPTPASWV